MNAVERRAVEHPFALDQPQAYLRWRERKLARYPRRAEDLIVEVHDPRQLSDSEAREIRRVCEALGLDVQRLVRERFGPINLGKLPRAECRPLTKRELALIHAL